VRREDLLALRLADRRQSRQKKVGSSWEWVGRQNRVERKRSARARGLESRGEGMVRAPNWALAAADRGPSASAREIFSVTNLLDTKILWKISLWH
jgi:hypothetical protein